MIFNDIFYTAIWLMTNSDDIFNEVYVDFLMEINGEGIEKIKKDRNTSYMDETQFMLFKRKSNAMELKLDTDYKTYLFQCDKIGMEDLNKLSYINLNEAFDLEEYGIRIGKLHIFDKEQNQIYSHFFSLVKSSEHYHVVYGRTTGNGDNLRMLGTSFKSFLQEEVHDVLKNNKNLR